MHLREESNTVFAKMCWFYLFSYKGISRLTRLLEPQIHVRLSYSLALTMASMQATSLLLMVANSVDKALSIAKPLNYSELVTYKVSIIMQKRFFFLILKIMNRKDELWNFFHLFYYLVKKHTPQNNLLILFLKIISRLFIFPPRLLTFL